MINADSIKDRLKGRSDAKGNNFQILLWTYGFERTLYRLSVSPYNERFTIKGGIFLYALFDGKFTRTTKDIDLLAFDISNRADEMKKIFTEILSIECDDALRYDLTTLTVRNITEFKKIHGVNILVMAYLDRTRIPVSIDVGYDDVIYPARVTIDFPVLLDMDAPKLYAYSIYSVLAEKFHAVVSQGEATSRYKDYYDINVIAGKFSLNGSELKEAVNLTFKNRNTGYNDIVAFRDEFAENEIHRRRWDFFVKKKRTLMQIDFAEVLALIKTLFEPIVNSIESNSDFTEIWDCREKKWISENKTTEI